MCSSDLLNPVVYSLTLRLMGEGCVGPGCLRVFVMLRWCLAWFVTRTCSSVHHLLTILGWRLGKASHFCRVVCLRVRCNPLGGCGAWSCSLQWRCIGRLGPSSMKFNTSSTAYSRKRIFRLVHYTSLMIHFNCHKLISLIHSRCHKFMYL